MSNEFKLLHHKLEEGAFSVFEKFVLIYLMKTIKMTLLRKDTMALCACHNHCSVV